MVILGKQKDAQIRNEVKKAIAHNPMITLRELQLVLYNLGYKSSYGNFLHIDYVSKIVHKVRGEGLRDVDESTIRARIAETRNRYNVATQRLSKIAHWQWEYLREGIPMPTPAEAIMAQKVIMEMDLKLLDAEMDAGIFKRNIGSIEVARRNVPIEDEKRLKIIEALKAWGFNLPQPTTINLPTPIHVTTATNNTTGN